MKNERIIRPRLRFDLNNPGHAAAYHLVEELGGKVLAEALLSFCVDMAKRQIEVGRDMAERFDSSAPTSAPTSSSF